MIARLAAAGPLARLRSAGRNQLFSNSTWSLFNQTARVASLAAVMIALSRHFDPSVFGSLACGLAFVRVFAVVAGFGLERVVVRQLIERPEESEAIVRKAFVIKLCVAAASYAAMLAMLLAIDYQDRLILAIAVVAGAGLLFQCCDVFEYALQAHDRFRSVFFGRGLPILAFAGVKLAVIFLGAPVLIIAALESVEAAAVGVALVVLYRRQKFDRPKQSARPEVNTRRLLRDGVPLLLGTLAVMIYMRTDVLMLGRLSSFISAGIYQAAAQITEACALAPMAFLPVLFPMIVRWRRAATASYLARFERLFFVGVLAAIGIATALTLAAPALVKLLYGAAYLPSAPLLMLHSWSIVFIFLSIIQIGYDITEGLTWFATARVAAGAMINVGLNFVLIPGYGAAGAAVATLCSQTCSSFLFNSLHPGTRPIFFMQLKAFALVPCLVMLVRLGRAEGRRQFGRSRVAFGQSPC